MVYGGLASGIEMFEAGDDHRIIHFLCLNFPYTHTHANRDCSKTIIII